MAKQIEVTRTFNAPVALVWKIWTDPELVKRWWGPQHFTCPFANIDFRVGGISLVSMRGPEAMGNQEFYSIWAYTKIIPLQTIEFIQSLANKDGIKTDPVLLGMPADFPADIRTVVNFSKIDDNTTTMTVMEYADFGSISHFAQIGLEQSMQKMESVF